MSPNGHPVSLIPNSFIPFLDSHAMPPDDAMNASPYTCVLKHPPDGRVQGDLHSASGMEAREPTLNHPAENYWPGDQFHGPIDNAIVGGIRNKNYQHNVRVDVHVNIPSPTGRQYQLDIFLNGLIDI